MISIPPVFENGIIYPLGLSETGKQTVARLEQSGKDYFIMKLLLTTLTLLLFAVTAFAWPDPADSTVPAQGDSLYDAHEFTRSLEIYKGLLSTGPANPEILWRISRCEFQLGKKDKLGGLEDSMLHHFEAGRMAGRQVIEVDENCAKGHMWYAANTGEVAMTKGLKEKVGMSAEVLHESERALELDSSEDGAMHAIGRWHYEVMDLPAVSRIFAKLLGLPDASYEDAEKHFRMAAETKPSYIEHHLYLGKTRLKMKKINEAREALEAVLSIPATDQNDPEFKKEAEELLKMLK